MRLSLLAAMATTLAFGAALGCSDDPPHRDSADDAGALPEDGDATVAQTPVPVDSAVRTGTDTGTDAETTPPTPPADAGAADTDGRAPPAQQPGPACPPLAAPTGNVVNVDTSQTAELQSIVSNASPGDTILLADGIYNLDGAHLWIDAPGLTLRSASGNREEVVLDGAYQTREIVTVAASDVTLADISLHQAFTHAVHVVSTDGADTDNTLIYNVHIVDPREQAIKINPHSERTHFADDGVVACSHIELTDLGRPNVNPTSGGCYTGGVDAHQARGWVIRDNRIQGFWCPSGLSEHAVHMWRGCRDTVVERNLLIDNARGVGFGLAQDGDARTYGDDPCPGAGYVGHYGGIVRNNFIFASRSDLFASAAGFDCGICLWSACGARALHNTVVSTGDNFSSVEWRFAASRDVEIVNNLLTHPLRERDGASAVQAGNLEGASLDLLKERSDGSDGDLHLAEDAHQAIDQGATVARDACTHDIDGDPRDEHPDIGADEVTSR